MKGEEPDHDITAVMLNLIVNEILTQVGILAVLAVSILLIALIDVMITLKMKIILNSE